MKLKKGKLLTKQQKDEERYEGLQKEKQRDKVTRRKKEELKQQEIELHLKEAKKVENTKKKKTMLKLHEKEESVAE